MTNSTNTPIRIGILGAARIGKPGLIDPARSVPEVQVVGVAARDPERARHYAARHKLPQSFASYDALLGSPDIDAVYNPLPNSLHAEWTIRALKAGKHVLCEKPFASNADEAERMAQAAANSGKVLSEAFHFRYHPLITRVKALLANGEIGQVRRFEAYMCFPLPSFADIRYRYELAGGSLMDAGSYPVSLIRFLANAEPDVTGARALLISPQVDRAMTADFRFADGRTAHMMSSMWSRILLRMYAVVKGDAGEIRIHNPYHPHWFHRLYIQGRSGKRVEHVSADSSYVCGLRAFAKAIREGAPLLTGPADSVAGMRVIDAIYEKAGLKRRGT